MPGVSRLGDSVQGVGSEHSGHLVPHTPVSISGYIDGGCSPNVFCNSLPVATVGSTTLEQDVCCGADHGVVSSGSSSVFVNGKPVARNGDSVNPHNGSVSITSGSPDVISN